MSSRAPLIPYWDRPTPLTDAAVKDHKRVGFNEVVRAGFAGSLEQQLAEAREALEFYANEGNYHPDGSPMTPYVAGKPDPSAPAKDRGRIARAALGKKETKA